LWRERPHRNFQGMGEMPLGESVQSSICLVILFLPFVNDFATTYPAMKAYLTKYCLTDGIQEVDDAEIDERNPSLLSVKSLGAFAYFHGEGREWHRTRESALKNAEDRRLARIRSLKRKLDKLEVLRFT
jgi:hypothetical protein